MQDPYSYSSTIAKAASRARGDRLSKLYQICSQQKSVSTRKLFLIVEKLRESDQLDAIHLAELANKLEKQKLI